MLISNGDTLLTALFIIGLLQYFWLSVVFVRKGFAPSVVRLSMVPMLTIWALIWPAYDNVHMPLYMLALLLIPILFAQQTNYAFSRHLKLCWHSLPPQAKQPSPWLMIVISLFICAQLFALAPELGLGLILSFTFAWHAAEAADKIGKVLRLGLTNNAQQTLIGHLLLVVLTSLICAWSLQLYHGIPWHQFLIATLVVGLVGSIIRALVAAGWNMPLSILGMSMTLWLL